MIARRGARRNGDMRQHRPPRAACPQSTDRRQTPRPPRSYGSRVVAAGSRIGIVSGHARLFHRHCSDARPGRLTLSLAFDVTMPYDAIVLWISRQAPEALANLVVRRIANARRSRADPNASPSTTSAVVSPRRLAGVSAPLSGVAEPIAGDEGMRKPVSERHECVASPLGKGYIRRIDFRPRGAVPCPPALQAVHRTDQCMSLPPPLRGGPGWGVQRFALRP